MFKLDLINRIRRFYKLPENNPEFIWTRSTTYQKRLEQVKSGWIVAGLLMLMSGSTSAVIVIGAFSGFLSLAFLERN